MSIPLNTQDVQPITLADVPLPDADFQLIYQFAHTVHGYNVAGSFQNTVDIANDPTKTDLLSLRIRLFFAARAHRHASLQSDSPEMRGLVAQIRSVLQDSDTPE